MLSSSALVADGGVTFHDIAQSADSGLTYARVPSPRKANFDALKQQGTITGDEMPLIPNKPHGAPGIALFDHDRDGDLDIYVTNGPGAANSLFSNQHAESGVVTFIDVGPTSGADATSQDSSGVCFGDIDNDGDHDLYVLGSIEPNRLFENQGDGTFAEITDAAGVGGGAYSSTSCAMGDVDNDGYLDIFVGNSHTDWRDTLALFDPFRFNEHNQLFRNRGDNTFADISATSGVQTLGGYLGSVDGAAGLTLAVALVDYDLDGDLDIFTADDQGAVPMAIYGGVDRGLIQAFRNDGTGQFENVSSAIGLDKPGAWMGLAFGDLDCNGRLDLFASNFGDHLLAIRPFPFARGDATTRWFLGHDDGTFSDPGVGDLKTAPFGWGAAVTDYDNDGDSDIVYHGGVDFGVVVDLTNPGTVLQNQGCSATFDYDANALAQSTNHTRRAVEGVAVGDLDGNGFVDIVSVASFDVPPSTPVVPIPVQYDSPFDAVAMMVPTFTPNETWTSFTWNGFSFDNGSLSVELNSADNGNHWIAVDLVGTMGITPRGRVNRDGIGATVQFRSPRRKSAMVPVSGGASYASQDSLRAHLGIGDERRGWVDVLWPGGTKNRLYTVRHGEQIRFPEIPCSYDGAWEGGFFDYGQCVYESLDALQAAGQVDDAMRARLFLSAIRAYFDSRGSATTVTTR
ncbi:MAG: CRTAC1 family protein [Acidobacteriota bacterium]